MAASKPVAAGLQAANDVITRYRWRICALCFFATTVNYTDRQVLSLLAPELQHVIGWNEIQYSSLVNSFQLAYAIGLLLAGRFIDRVGTRIGYACAVGFWSVAIMSTAAARTVFGFGFAQFFVGIGESGNFPASIKTIAEWFPKRERALATGIFNSGANIGAVVGPLLVPWLNNRYGWQSAFLATGAISLLWIVPWLMIYRPPQMHPRVSPGELALIQSEPPEPGVKVPWTNLLAHRQTWAFVIGKFMTDPIWWFIMFWFPKFLTVRYGLTLTALAWPIVVVYNVSTVGSVGGGWLSAMFLKLGWSVNRARKTAMAICAVAVAPVIFAATSTHLWVTVMLVGIATAAHQGWSANIFTLASDMFPKRTVASVVGIGGFGGSIGGVVMSTLTGLVLQYTHSYMPMFAIAASAYLLALVIIHALAPRLEPADIAA
ncbi:MAG TPA: MFS transporter [Bryobacteraceae bacterium]|nr:MFS transporter [Bryobacteraceae bacterium]